MIAITCATRTGPKNGIDDKTFHAGSRRAAAIIAVFAFARSSDSVSSWVSRVAARTRAPPSSFASHAFLCDGRYTDTPGAAMPRARNMALDPQHDPRGVLDQALVVPHPLPQRQHLRCAVKDRLQSTGPQPLGRRLGVNAIVLVVFRAAPAGIEYDDPLDTLDHDIVQPLRLRAFLEGHVYAPAGTRRQLANALAMAFSSVGTVARIRTEPCSSLTHATVVDWCTSNPR